MRVGSQLIYGKYSKYVLIEDMITFFKLMDWLEKIDGTCSLILLLDCKARLKMLSYFRPKHILNISRIFAGNRHALRTILKKTMFCKEISKSKNGLCIAYNVCEVLNDKVLVTVGSGNSKMVSGVL